MSGPILNIFVTLSHLLLMTVCEIGSFHTADRETEAGRYICMYDAPQATCAPVSGSEYQGHSLVLCFVYILNMPFLNLDFFTYPSKSFSCLSLLRTDMVSTSVTLLEPRACVCVKAL